VLAVGGRPVVANLPLKTPRIDYDERRILLGAALLRFRKPTLAGGTSGLGWQKPETETAGCPIKIGKMIAGKHPRMLGGMTTHID